MSIGIIIQGPWHTECTKSINEYKKYGDVVISTYFNYGAGYDVMNSNITILESPIPDIKWYNANNLYYQAYTTYMGLCLLETDNVIKVRCNESYSDISQFVQKILDNPNKIITNNIAFTRTKTNPLHPSDHMIGGNTAIIRAAFYDIMQTCKKLPAMESNIYGGELGFEWIGHLLSEQMICLHLLKYFGIDENYLKDNHDIESLNTIMKKHFDVVPVEDLGDVVHSISVPGGRNFRKNGEGLYGYEHESIKNMDDL
jgi:hypothetical protein